MSEVNPNRFTHAYEGELVVFLIGMRINKPWRPDLWFPIFMAMPKMLKELSIDKDSGLLGYRTAFTKDGPVLIQYWSSHERLYAYAGNPNAEHRPAWTSFNKMARRAPGAVGIYHETYLVDRAETFYGHMPPLGLAAATSAVPVARRGERAAERLAYKTAG